MSSDLPFLQWIRSSTSGLATSSNNSNWVVLIPNTFLKEYCVWRVNKQEHTSMVLRRIETIIAVTIIYEIAVEKNSLVAAFRYLLGSVLFCDFQHSLTAINWAHEKGGGNTNQVWVASLFYIFIKHTYLLVFPISVSFKTIRSMQLNGGAADHLNTAFLILWSKGPYTAVHLQ